MHLLVLALAMLQASHNVQLNWQASPDAVANPSLSYEVNRGSGNCTTNPTMTKIGSAAAGVLTFTDPNVNVGQTWCYSVNSTLNGLQSTNNPTTTAVILPSPPPTLTNKPN